MRVNCDVKGIDNIDTSNPEILLVGAQDDPLLAAAALALRDKARVTRADTPCEAVEQLTCAPAELAIFRATEPLTLVSPLAATSGTIRGSTICRCC